MISRLGALRITDRTRWVREISQTMTAARGNATEAAKALGVSKRQLMRWLAELPEIKRAAPGRPRGTMVERDPKRPRKAEKRRWRRWESNPLPAFSVFGTLQEFGEM